MKVTSRTNFVTYTRTLTLLTGVGLLLSLLAACGDDVPVLGLASNGSTAAPAATATATPAIITTAVTTPTVTTPATIGVATSAATKITPISNTPITTASPIPTVNITVQPGQSLEFKLKIGQTALVQPDNIQIKFLRVVSDERCANCTVSGPITLEAVVTQNGQTLGTFTLNDRNNYKYKTSETFKGYTLSLIIVAPNRCGGCNEIKAEDYVSTFGLSSN